METLKHLLLLFLVAALAGASFFLLAWVVLSLVGVK